MNSDSVPVSTLAEIISDFLEEAFAFFAFSSHIDI